MSTDLEVADVHDGAVVQLPPDDVIDKTYWGEGPWQHEPDWHAFERDGYDCLVMRSLIGSLCGYVAIPSDHPWYGMTPEEIPVRVHGGLEWKNYGNDEFRRACRDDVAWFGFSCSHLGDYHPVDGMIYENGGKPTDEGSTWLPKRSYKTIEYVKEHIAVFCDAAVLAARTT